MGAIVLGYLMSMVSSGFVNWIEFDVNAILHGQIWRLFSWIFMPTTSLDFFGLLFLLCVLMWGSSLESMLGTFRMNVFLWGGVILSDIGGIIIYVITKIVLGSGASVYLSTYYILMSMLLALAICMPEGEVRLYFVLPIKMKWMLVFELLYLAYIVFSTFKSMLAYSNSIMGWILGLVVFQQSFNKRPFFWIHFSSCHKNILLDCSFILTSIQEDKSSILGLHKIIYSLTLYMNLQNANHVHTINISLSRSYASWQLYHS